jgi:leucyl/phenylalanyl-tRNA--protein transferase
MVFQLDETLVFPKPSLADEDGLLAIGGDLSTDRLLLAYENGIFPWYSEGEPICWYSPHQRFVILPNEVKVSKSMMQVIRSQKFIITCNSVFCEVIVSCANALRLEQDGTWIIPEMQKAYINLHQEGFAHSVEVWQDGELVGGLYGILIGKVFCGESMFSKVSNASKLALIWLCQNLDVNLVDCQLHTEHLESMGAKMISRAEFMRYFKV